MQIFESGKTGFKFWFWPPLAVRMWEIWVSELSLSFLYLKNVAPDIYVSCYKTYSTWQTVNGRQLSARAIKCWRLGSKLHGPTEHFPEVSHLMCQKLQFTLFSSFLPQCVASPSLDPLDGESPWSQPPCLLPPFTLFSSSPRSPKTISLLFSQAPTEVRFLFSACTNGKPTAKGYFVRQPSRPLVHWAHSMSCWQRHRFDHASLMDCHGYRTNSRSSAWTLSGLHSAF